MCASVLWERGGRRRGGAGGGGHSGAWAPPHLVHQVAKTPEHVAVWRVADEADFRAHVVHQGLELVCVGGRLLRVDGQVELAEVPCSKISNMAV